ncbi:unnamed protein product [Rhodiola kirilowii]
MAIGFRVFLLALILLVAPLLQVARCSEPDPDLDIAEPGEGGDIGIVGDDVHDFSEETFSSAPGIETVTVFPKNVGKLVTAGEETELLVGLKNNATYAWHHIRSFGTRRADLTEAIKQSREC